MGNLSLLGEVALDLALKVLVHSKVGEEQIAAREQVVEHHEDVVGVRNEALREVGRGPGPEI